jgi:hypothetical protein
MEDNNFPPRSYYKQNSIVLTLTGLLLIAFGFGPGIIESFKDDQSTNQRNQAKEDEKIWEIDICLEPIIEDEGYPRPELFNVSLQVGPVFAPPDTQFFSAACHESDDACCVTVELNSMRRWSMMVGGIAFTPNLHPHGRVETYVYTTAWIGDKTKSSSYKSACPSNINCDKAVVPEWDPQSNRMLFIMSRSDFGYKAIGTKFLSVQERYSFETVSSN